MKLVTYLHQGTQQPGILSRDGAHVYSLQDLGCGCATLLELIEGWTPALRQSLEEALDSATGGTPLADVQLLAPIPRPRHDILCVGQNYTAHAIESAKFKGAEYVQPEYPVYFSKRVVHPVGQDGEIRSHSGITQQLDYEVELAVIMGKTCDGAKPEEVFDYIFGYTIVNDISAREIQNRHQQYYLGKSLNDSAPMGPWIVTRDEFSDPPHLAVKTRINGELRQDSNTADFIFSIPHMISQISAGITLEAGDILITGTPSGVGMGYNPPRFLKSGDVIECEVEGIGVLRNRVK